MATRIRVGRKRRLQRTPTNRLRVVEKQGSNPSIPEQVTVDREDTAWRLYTREGKTQREIAAVLKVTQQAVCLMLRRVEDRTLSDLKDETLREKARQIARLTAIFNEAISAWHSSKAGFRRISERRSGGGFVTPAPGKGKGKAKGAAAGKTKAARDLRDLVSQTTEEFTHGDPRFLGTALEASRDLRKLLGIDAPTQFKGTFEHKPRPLETMTPDELHQEIAAAQSLLGELGVTIH